MERQGTTAGSSVDRANNPLGRARATGPGRDIFIEFGDARERDCTLLRRALANLLSTNQAANGPTERP